MSLVEFNTWLAYFAEEHTPLPEEIPSAEDMSGDEIAARLGAF